jgi:hypothetical protein
MGLITSLRLTKSLLNLIAADPAPGFYELWAHVTQDEIVLFYDTDNKYMVNSLSEVPSGYFRDAAVPALWHLLQTVPGTKGYNSLTMEQYDLPQNRCLLYASPFGKPVVGRD